MTSDHLYIINRSRRKELRIRRNPQLFLCLFLFYICILYLYSAAISVLSQAVARSFTCFIAFLTAGIIRMITVMIPSAKI